MAAPNVNDLDGLLSSLNSLKPPGASKNKIATITTLCVSNIQAETNIVQSFYRALKKAPATHKLGALYVIDSVVRQWIEKAKAAGQDLHVEGRGEAGTYPAAVKRVTELMPALFDDLMKGIPADQKSKLENMIMIWERGNTFPAKLLADFKSKLHGTPGQATAPVNGMHESMLHSALPPPATGKYAAPIPTRPMQTPVGYPPRQLYEQGFLPGRSAPQQANGRQFMPPQPTPAHHNAPVPRPLAPTQATPAADVNSILAALSKAAVNQPIPAFPLAQPQGAPAQAPPAAVPPSLAALFAQHAGFQPPTPQQAPPQQQAPPAQYSYHPSSVPPMPTPAFPPPPIAQFAGHPQPPPSVPQGYSIAPPPQQGPPAAADPLAQLRGFLPENILNDRQKLIPALQLLQDLQKDGIPPDKWGPVLKAFEEQYQQPASVYATRPDQGLNRGRSRSPDRAGRGGRGSPVYGAYDANTRNQQEEARDSRGALQRGRYRQRSPARNSPSATAMNGRPMQPKVIEFDGTLPQDNIKVLSRTLFVGGANGNQQEIQELFERFGRVQTCIANRDKRHAFVKMTTRQYALAAKSAMEDLQLRNDRETMNIARQTKWGVGFGPRECCDYQRGESIIPIHKLTEADVKWLLTAEYGGTGGLKLEGGMVLEEPDIEIGAGVSSKAMSKRIGPDNAPPAKRHHREEQHRGGRKHKTHDRDGQYVGANGGANGGPPPAVDPYQYARPEPVEVATPPAVPGFGFNLGLPTGGANNTYR